LINEKENPVFRGFSKPSIKKQILFSCWEMPNLFTLNKLGDYFEKLMIE